MPDVELRTLLKLLRLNLALLRSAVMVGNPCPKVAAMYRAMMNPKPGDFVVEATTLYYPMDDLRKIGTLLRDVREDIPGADLLSDGRKQTDRVWYIRGLDGQEHRWTNASFMRIAADDADIWEIEGNDVPPTISTYTVDAHRANRLLAASGSGLSQHSPTEMLD